MHELLSAVVLLLELDAREMQRVEFVVQDGKYFIIAVRETIYCCRFMFEIYYNS